MDELDLAYVAGFFDGEGCAYLSTPKASNGKRYSRLTAKIAQNDRTVLDWIAELFGFGSVYQKYDKRELLGYKTNYYVTFTHKQARVFLTVIEPFLRVKRDVVTSLLDVTGREYKDRRLNPPLKS